MTNSKPQEYTVERYLQEKPSAKWLRLTDGRLDLSNLSYASTFGVGRISEVYIPLESPGSSLRDEIHILVATKDPVLLQFAEKMRAAKSKEDTIHFLQEHGQELIVRRKVQGLIQFGIDLEEDKTRKLRSLNANLAPDFILFAEGEHPDYAVSFVMLLSGIVLGGFLLKQAFGSAPNPSVTQPPPLPPPLFPPSSQPPPLPMIK